MLTLEDFMNVRDLKQQGWSVSAMAAQLNLDRKTVRKYLLDQVRPYKREPSAVQGRSVPALSAGALGARRAQRQQAVG